MLAGDYVLISSLHLVFIASVRSNLPCAEFCDYFDVGVLKFKLKKNLTNELVIAASSDESASKEAA